MESLTNTYFTTINPLLPYSQLFTKDVICSIILHTILYICLIYILDKLFKIKISKEMYCNIMCFLVVVMSLGYVGRLARSKSIYQYYIARGFSRDQSLQKAIDLMHFGYYRFYFLG